MTARLRAALLLIGSTCVSFACVAQSTSEEEPGDDAGEIVDTGTFGSDAARDPETAGDAGVATDTASDTGPACVEETIGSGPLVREGKCGKLVYGKYANRDDTRVLNVLPDFSWAGYEGGGVAIPEVPVVRTLEPATGDDRARIQAAIDAVAALPLDAKGFRGAVLLRKGTYRVSDALRIKTSGIVLRGEGQGAGGTTLLATAAKQYTLIEIAGSTKPLGEVSGTKTRTAAFVPVGSRSFEVKSASALAVGDRIVVRRTPNQKWIDDLKMGTYGWTPGGYTIDHERTVVAKDGNVVTVDIPIVDALDEKYGGGEVFVVHEAGRVRHAGVEDLRLDSSYASETDEAHAWNGISLAGARDSWVRRVTALHFGYSAVSILDGSAFNTVEDTAHLDPKSQITGGRRYSFNVSGGLGNLFQRCFAREGRHNFVTGSGTTGPNVWLDCVATDNHGDDGPHHRWSTGLLFDNTQSGALDVQNRKDSGSGHGWAGAQTLFFNVKATSLVSDAPPGAMNWSVGATGAFRQGNWAPEEPDGIRELTGETAKPRSLYLAQLRDRLGESAVLAVTAPAQRRGRIWTELTAWAGEGKLLLP